MRDVHGEGSADPPSNDGSGTGISRRNLPRASHACQRCRAKKARCDQEKPCSNCVRHATACIYGVRRSNAKDTRRHGRLPASIEPDGASNGRHVTSVKDTALTSARPPVDASPFTCTPSSGASTLAAERHNAHSQIPQDAGQGVGQTQNHDGLGDVNPHTNGTEFYGTSSNYVLLNQLFSYARQHLRPGQSSHEGRGHASFLTHPSPTVQSNSTVQTPVMASDNLTGTTSVVNLLSTDDALVPPSRARTPTSELDPSSVPTRLSNAAQQSRHAGKRNQLYSSNAVPAMPFELAEQRLERELVRSYLHNLHYLHPMLDSRVFSAQCEEVMWAAGPKSTRSRDDRHFIALYNIVVAVGALVSSRDTMDDLGLDIRLFQQTVPGSSETAQHSLLRNLSRKYFQKSRAALGDVFEACSLESAQTLLLMSLYCQNFLKPHACYMYSGMAVRTALAIGLPTESISSSVEARKAARRTWWCIYSHESDMSCSSGRRDSLAKPRNYPVPFPRIKGRSPEQATLEDEDHGVAMINEMVHFAVVLRRISKEIYHNTKGLTMLQKSNVANQLDALLLEWKSNLPEWLNFEVVTFCGTEMAAKQKLVLHLRYLNARIILHRPFLADFHGGDAAIRKKHVDLCVDAARETIRVLYSAYASLPYFRTWWYNSTYSLYAGMIILYAIMLGHTSVPSNNLVEDVKKSRDILRSMEEASVARRSADLMSEVLDMARAYSQRERSTEPEMVETGSYNNEQQGHQQSHQGHPDMDELFSREYFQNTDPGQDPEALLASLIESNMLQDFTAADVGSADLDFSMLPTYGDLGFLVNDQYNGLVPIGQGFG